MVGACLAACTPTPKAVSASSGYLPVKVMSVNAALEPYNPQYANQGIPAEQVSFTVSSVSGDVSCSIDVLRSGPIVGKTFVGFGPSSGSSGSLRESWAVEGIKGSTFLGEPSNAHVTCRE
jgi:hypothetical protein